MNSRSQPTTRSKVVSSPRKFKFDGTVDRHASIKVLSISEACKLSPGSLVSMMVKIQSADAPVEILRSGKQTHVTKQDCNIAQGRPELLLKERGSQAVQKSKVHVCTGTHH